MLFCIGHISLFPIFHLVLVCFPTPTPIDIQPPTPTPITYEPWVDEEADRPCAVRTVRRVGGPASKSGGEGCKHQHIAAATAEPPREHASCSSSSRRRKSTAGKIHWILLLLPSLCPSFSSSSLSALFPHLVREGLFPTSSERGC